MTVALGVDRVQLEYRLRRIEAIMDAHAGGVELDDVADDGTVKLRFTGMCTGCGFRPLTMYGTIVPELLEVPGVTRVLADGTRISDEALERMRRYFGSEWSLHR